MSQATKQSIWVIVAGIASITILSAMMILTGRDGYLFLASVSLIAGLAGYKIKGIIQRK